MGIKNIILGPDEVARPRVGGFNDKPILHGDGPGHQHQSRDAAPLLHPSLTVIDGFEGMEGMAPATGPS